MDGVALMKYFIDIVGGEIFAYESDGFQEEWVREGLEPLDEKGLAEARAAQAAAAAPTPEQLLNTANAQRDSLLAVAGLRIAPLQDAVDLGDVSVSEEAELKSWKQYRVALNRVQLQPDYPATVDWPAMPNSPLKSDV